jgi:hypothetical protein
MPQLPPVHEDPSIVEGRKVREEYVTKTVALRADVQLSDLAKAEGITAAWETASRQITALWHNLVDRRQTRLAKLEALIPVGPNIAPGTSPADEAVLRQAFRSQLAEARTSGMAERQALLADAEKFDDDIARRAVLTASFETGDMAVVNAWAEQNNLTEGLEEMRYLHALLGGTHVQNGHDAQALGALPKPQEAANLPRLREQAAAFAAGSRH